MSRLPLHRTVIGLFVGLALAASVAADPPTPKDQGAKEDAPGTKRLVYFLKRGTAKDLAPVLSGSFKGAAEVQALPDQAGNGLLITAPFVVLEEVLKLLEQIDRPPQTAVVEVWILAVGNNKAAGDKVAEDVDEKDLTGALAVVAGRVDALERKGAFASVKHIRIPVLEGQAVSVLLGEDKPFVTGVSMTRGGVAARSVMYRNLGVKAEASVRVTAEKVVTVDLKLEDTHAVVPEDGVSIGTDENGKPIYAAQYLTSTLTSKLELPSGTARLAEGVKTDGKPGGVRTLVVVGARQHQSDAKPEK